MNHLKNVGGLSITRSAGEELKIGDTIVQVVSVERGRVRLRIAGPAKTEIMRGELLPAGWVDELKAAHNNQAVGV